MNFHSFCSELVKLSTKDEEAKAKAEEIRGQLKRRYNVSPYLSGSMATGLNLPGQYDYDYGVRIKSKPKFERLAKRLGRSGAFKASPYNKPGTDYHVFTGKVGDEDVDLALLYGDKGLVARKATATARENVEKMSPEEREKILKTKAFVKGLKKTPIIGDIKWKGKPLVEKYVEKPWKRSLDERIGLVRLKKEELPEDEKVARELTEGERKRLTRSNVFGHRTGNLDPIISSGKILSAATAGKKGLLKSVETADPTSREREEAKGKKTLRSEVFLTKGLMPAEGTYGKYGILFEKRKAMPSRYLNTIPTEHVVPGVTRSKMTFVVPDKEYAKWQAKHPERRIMRESEVPESKRLSGKSYSTLLERALSGPKLTQETEEVDLG
jgi:hypothetical protein